MTIFAINCKLHNDEDRATISNLLEAWEGLHIMGSTWILKRNDGCTCQTIMEDLLEHISADNEISVVEIGREDNKARAAGREVVECLKQNGFSIRSMKESLPSQCFNQSDC